MSRKRERGLTLVELMVGLALGLVIVAAGLLLLAQHLRENRSLLLQARLVQDLRSASELMAHDLRRAGYWGHAAAGLATAQQAPQANPYASLGTDGNIAYTYSRDDTENHTVDTNERFGYRLRQGVIEMQLGQGNWQALTDAGSLQVTSLRITPQLREVVLDGACREACAPGSTQCPPRQQLRSLALQISARATTDTALTRSTTLQVQLRNDALSGACPA